MKNIITVIKMFVVNVKVNTDVENIDNPFMDADENMALLLSISVHIDEPWFNYLEGKNTH